MTRCPSCGAADPRPFYVARDLPVHSVLLMETRAEALAYPRGDLVLAHCGRCGFLTNTAFEAGRHEYSTRYEETQGFSPTFNAFLDRLAQRTVATHDLVGKRVLEIGCGKAEFLARLVAHGVGHAVGVDPAVVPERVPEDVGDRLELVQEFWSRDHGVRDADLVVCRHTLEHIAPVGAFVRELREAIGTRDVPVLFELPETLRVLDEAAFWDVYYEHCSYFTPGSLTRLFRAAGFEPEELWLDYDEQYVLLGARPADGGGASGVTLSLEDDLARTAELVARFEKEAPRAVARLRDELRTRAESGQRVVFWGAGSKAVALVTTAGLADELDVLCDVNPYKQGRFLPASGHVVVAPEELVERRPDCVVVMNPIYLDEVRAELARLGLAPEVVAL